MSRTNKSTWQHLLVFSFAFFSFYLNYRKSAIVDPVIYPITVCFLTLMIRPHVMRHWDGVTQENAEQDERVVAIQANAATSTLRMTTTALIVYASARPAWPPHLTYMAALWLAVLALVSETGIELYLRTRID